MKEMKLDNEIEKTLSSLDKVDKPTLGADFDEALLHKVSFLPKSSTGMNWLKFSAAAMLLMTLVNVLLLVNWNAVDSHTEEELSSGVIYEGIDYTEFE